MNATGSRKRGRSPATQANPLQGSQPTVTHSLAIDDPAQFSALSNDQFVAYGTDPVAPNYPVDSSAFGFGQGKGQQSGDRQATQSSPSNQMVRRNPNTGLTVRGNRDVVSGQDAWQEPGNVVANTWEEFEDGDDLDAKAAVAKRDAQSKRPPKQIPPFIQKLSSFLDQSRNTDLIRWSDDGNSFIVLDEERFANELIPELFKHKNYASFVRQLNMYGFHKRVGLADNSMRASERKARTPSEYFNPYFKRGRPELLWLIQKPKPPPRGNASGHRRSEGQGQDSDDEEQNGNSARPNEELEKSNMSISTVSQPAFNSLQKEVAQLQRSQEKITGMLVRLKDENNQYIRQASAMVAQHERHENSINAILTFLATFYNRSLESQGNLPNMFANAFTGNNQFPGNQQQGNVVDVGDFDENSFSPSNHQFQMPRQARRPLALLPAPTSEEASTQTPTPPPRQNSSTPQAKNLQVPQQRPQFPGQSNLRNSPISATSTPSPAVPSPAATANQQPNIGNQPDDIMSVIHNANAQHNRSTSVTDPSKSPTFDFELALQHYQHADGQAPLTDEQRNTMLKMMANNSGTTTPNPFRPGVGDVNQYQGPLDYFSNTGNHLDMLARLQEEQDSKMQNLADRLQPLSPSGSIPGFAISPSSGGVSPNGYNNTQTHHNNGSTSDFDINAFFNDLTNEPENGNGNKSQHTDGHQNHGPTDVDSYFPFVNDPDQFSGGDVDFGNLADDENYFATPAEQGAVHTNTHDTDSLFSDDEEEQEEDEEEEPPTTNSTPQPPAPELTVPPAAHAPGRKTSIGKVIGSVGSNSAAATPSVESASDTEDEGRGSVDGRGGRKRRKLGR